MATKLSWSIQMLGLGPLSAAVEAKTSWLSWDASVPGKSLGIAKVRSVHAVEPGRMTAGSTVWVVPDPSLSCQVDLASEVR